MIKVLMISVRADHGGGPRHMELLINELRGTVDFSVACPRDMPYFHRFSSLLNGHVLTIPHRKFDVFAAFRLARYVREESIHIVHSHGKGAGLYARLVTFLSNAMSVHTPHGIHTSEYSRIKKSLYRLYENITSSRVSYVVFVSKEEKLSAESAGLWPNTRSHIVENGVPEIPSEFSRENRRITREMLGIKDGDAIVATISRFDYQKNMDEALQIAALLPFVIFIWIGDGPNRDRLAKEAISNGINNIILLGHLDDPARIIAAADLYLSTSRWEGLPLAVLEALSMGIPVIVSDVVGHGDVIARGSVGVSYPLGKPEVAALKIRDLINDGDMRRKFGRAAIDLQRQYYSAKKMSEEIYQLYSKMNANFE